MCIFLLLLRRYGAIVSLAMLTLGFGLPLSAQFDKPNRIQAGRDIFTREFDSNIDSTVEGDGLGPVFNARSCATCHHQVGVGGGGDNQFNVHILSVMPPKKTPVGAARNRFRTTLAEIHPDLPDQGTIILHRDGIRPAYLNWRERLLGLQFDDPNKTMSSTVRRKRLKHLDDQGPVVRLPTYRGIEFMVTQRNTTSLMGANLIDGITDQMIEEMAARQQAVNDGINGQVSRLRDEESGTSQIGKFGWRGQSATLEEFVRGACVAEMGLQIDDLVQPIDPTAPAVRVGSRKELEQDLSGVELDQLVQFVRSLPAPAVRIPAESKALTAVLLGRAHFHSMGCATCHVPSLGNVDGIYSDLLLHDMGQSLEDPLPTPGINSSLRVGTGRFRSGGWLGGRREIFVEQPNIPAFRNWRTPPLWGVADSAPYMHDGRAATLHDAISCHDGEGLTSARQYANLSRKHRTAVIAFLKALGQPEP